MKHLDRTHRPLEEEAEDPAVVSVRLLHSTRSSCAGLPGGPGAQASGDSAMAVLPLRLFGLFLLTLAIVIPSCQALFPRGAADAPQPFRPEFVRD